jgi:phytoene dehydrogenase-like protein
VLYRKHVSRILLKDGRPLAVATDRSRVFPADLIVANLTPWNLRRLLGEQAAPALRQLPLHPEQGWGAFTVYAGIDDTAVPRDFPLHHQVVLREPFGEGNTMFLSINPEWDERRTPSGSRALTISTHTKLQPWWSLYDNDRTAYEKQKERYTQRVLQAAETVLPGLRNAARIVLPGTPISFQRFTQREWGWVGGFPQVNLFQVWGSRRQPGIWMVGDSIFPGQSTAATALGGLCVAQQILSSTPMLKSQELSPGSPRLQPSHVLADGRERDQKRIW